MNKVSGHWSSRTRMAPFDSAGAFLMMATLLPVKLLLVGLLAHGVVGSPGPSSNTGMVANGK